MIKLLTHEYIVDVDVLIKKNDNKMTQLNYFMKTNTSDL